MVVVEGGGGADDDVCVCTLCGLHLHLTSPVCVCISCCPCPGRCSDGRCLRPQDYYKLRMIGADFAKRPPAVANAMARLGKGGASARAFGIAGFAKYTKAFYKNLDVVSDYYSAPRRLGAKQWQQDKRRSLMQSILSHLAPNEQVPPPPFPSGRGPPFGVGRGAPPWPKSCSLPPAGQARSTPPPPMTGVAARTMLEFPPPTR